VINSVHFVYDKGGLITFFCAAWLALLC